MAIRLECENERRGRQAVRRSLFIWSGMLAALTISLLTLNGSGLFCSFRCFSPVKDGWLPNSLPNSIRILSYNFFLRPPLISSGRKGDYKNERLKTFIQTQLHLYDIICFQEVFQFASFRRSELVKEAASRGFKYHAAAPAALIDGGLLIISRFPIRSCAFKSYSRGIHSDFLANKGVLYAQIVLNDGICIDLFTTHLQASYKHPSSAREIAIRTSQLEKLHSFVLEKTGGTNTNMTIIAGDFNIDATTKELDFQFLLQKFSPFTFATDGTATFGASEECYSAMIQGEFEPERTLTAPHDWNTCQSIDYMMYKSIPRGCTFKCTVNPMQVQGKPFTHLSDHFALSAVLYLKEEQDSAAA